MEQIQSQMHGVWTAVAAATGGAGAAVMFLGAHRDDGVSEIARSFALLSASRATRSVWLVDLDFYSDIQFSALSGQNGPMGGPFDMTFGRAPFWRATPRGPNGGQGEGALVGYRTSVPKLFVSKFVKSNLHAQQKLQVIPAPDYWRAVREKVDMTVLDAPALDSSRAGLALVADMDGVVLVIDKQRSNVRDAIELRDEVLARGGQCLGVIVAGQGKRSRKPVKQRRSVEEQVEQEEA